MTEKRFTLSVDTEWWFVDDNTINVNEYGYRDDLTGNDKYRGLKKTLTEQEVVDLLNTLNDENEQLKSENEYLRCTIEDYKGNEECNKEFINNLHDYNQKLKKENEQLKQFKEKVFVLLAKEITRNEEAIEWGEKQGADVGAMVFHTNMLKILRKELRE